jgi:tRNA (uracil-5-)-methyltransferase TRM9
VDANTVSHLLDINREFYQTFALQFSTTRQRLQPGVIRILNKLPSKASVLDLGCGNGELAKELHVRHHQGAYLGLDSNSKLLSIAREHLASIPSIKFLLRDLSLFDWDIGLPITEFDTILAFAVLHHIPSNDLRHQIIEKVRSLLVLGGRFIHSEWQFVNSPRLLARVQSWEEVGLSPAHVDAGDYLIDWRQGGYGLRYVHHFEEQELATLANETGFKIVETFNSDGEGGKLGLYQIWEIV